MKLSIATCAAAWVLLVPTPGNSTIPVITDGGGAGRHLSASAQMTRDSLMVRVSHRAPGGTREAGAHIHVRVAAGDSRVDVVRGIPPRSPKARMRQTRDLIFVTVPIPAGAEVRDVRVTCVPGPHAGCLNGHPPK